MPLVNATEPVTVIVSLTPPYTPFLNEYGAAGVNNLQVSLLVNDSRMQNYPAKLQMVIEHIGSGVVMQTNQYAAIPPMMLTGNITEVLSGFDLSKYFLAHNNIFSGFDQNQYIQTGRIPDGQYRIGFRVVDAQRNNVVLSNTAYSQPGWFVLNDPPQLNLPRNKDKLRVSAIQNVKIEWFPRHLGSLNSAFASSYQVEIFPIRVPSMDPNQVVLSTQPDFTDITRTTSYYLTSDKYMLEPGVEYAFRIKAMAGDGQLSLFQNNGYSEVFTFIYGTLCPEPSNLSAETTINGNANISWETDPRQTSFEVRLRKAGNENDRWYTRNSFRTSTNISSVLSAGQQYEYQVKATCNTVESDYSKIAYFTMPKAVKTQFSCGASDSVLVSNKVPKASLQPGDIVYYGKFPIKLTKVTGASGNFSGEGRMRIPFMAYAQVNMQFSGIKVNELNQVYEGEMVSIYNPDSKLIIDDITDYIYAGDQVGRVFTGQEQAQLTLSYPVENTSQLKVILTDNTVTVEGPDGESHTSEIVSATGGTTIADTEGNLFAVNDEGKITKVGKSGGQSNPENYYRNATTYNKVSDTDQIEFFNNEGDIWAFDTRKKSYSSATIIDNKYEKLGDSYVPWKLIPEGKSGKVKARLKGGSIIPDMVKFKTPTGTEYIASYKDSQFELTIVGGPHGDAQEIYALHQINDSVTVSLGKLNVASYNMMKHKLAIVPIGGAKISEKQIEKELDSIYLPYGIEWDVRLEATFTNKTWAGEDGLLDAGETGFFTAYTDEMKALRDAFKANRAINEDEIYLFVFDTVAAHFKSGTLLGDMPIGYQFGFIFQPNNEPITAKTIAHEIAHGKLQLKHTFDDSYGIAEKSTNNLMDYTLGTELVKHQWDEIYDPQKLLFAWAQDEEEGASHDVNIDELITWIKEKKNSVRALDQSDFYNFNVWGNKALEVDVGGQKAWVYSEVFDNGVVNLYEPYIDFMIDEKYRSGFCLSFKYNRYDEDAIRIWTYSFPDFELLLKELDYELTDELKNQIIAKYKSYIAENGDDCNNIDVVFENIPDFVLAEITIEERVECLSVLTECAVFNGGWIWGKNNDTDEQKAIRNLLKIDKEEHGELFKMISKTKTSSGKWLFEKLIEKCSHDDFTLLSADVLRWANENIDYTSYGEYDIKAIYWFDDSHNIWGERSYNFNSKGDLDFSITTRWFTNEGNVEGNWTPCNDINPLTPVVIRIEKLSSTEEHSTRLIEGMKEGSEYIMPAIVFAWMINHHDKLESQEMIKGGIMIASLFVNVKSLGSAGSLIAKVFATGTIVSDMGDVFFSNANVREKIIGLDYGAQFLEAWDVITKYYSKVTFSYSTLKGNPGAFTSFKMAWGELISKNIDLDQKLGSETFNTINEFCKIELTTD